jgi:BirA family transcriptional regulator, biotin operon repressor / biotin---[acetyl-CoA-carboxylase] ligase
MYKDRILNLLRASHTAFVSGEELARRTGISRTMVWKYVKSLEQDGFAIEAVPSQGYRIVSAPDQLRRTDVQHRLKTKHIGRELVILQETPSTNAVAMERAAGGAREGTVIVAEAQTEGRGRRGRKWISPKGNLYCSVVLRPRIPLHRAPLITLMGAVAAADAIRRACGLNPGIKWPNDILVGGKKVCGLLTEMSAEQDQVRHIVLGIGINANMRMSQLPAELQSQTTTLSRETGGSINRTTLLRELLRSLEAWYRMFLEDPSSVLGEWKARNTTLGRRVVVSGAGERLTGIAREIDDEGRLVLMLESGIRRAVAAGDVTILKE